MRIAIKLLALFAFILYACNSFAQSINPKIDSLINLITIDTYSIHFDSLRTNEFCSRKVVPFAKQSSDHNACRDYIYRQFSKNLGANNAYLHHFRSNNYFGLSNVIAFKQGTDPSAGIWVVSAHYDSNNNMELNPTSDSISPGANDNGTGVAAIIEISRILSNINTNITILFAAWDLEEVFTNGYPTGSNKWFKSHVKKRKRTSFSNKKKKVIINIKDLKGNLNFDMFGNPQLEEDGKPVLWACYAKYKHIEFAKEYANTLNQYIPEITTLVYGRLNLSDHYTFASRKIPSIENLESEYTLDPYYHTYSDNLENYNNIDFHFATNVTRGGLAFLLEQCIFY